MPHASLEQQEEVPESANKKTTMQFTREKYSVPLSKNRNYSFEVTTIAKCLMISTAKKEFNFWQLTKRQGKIMKRHVEVPFEERGG
jgi:hypothetical protein